ncbi:MAG: DEAD/DEAH box helicase [Candidatus Undinarchaeales archaeon]|jgi:ATP-dependent RNA helicase RhlE|nr:DEAD/DEAH box helicase [Candidatus Undinarchaeales archaeon]MDP7491625.1 DEAD/DEAH box helicase [Candidatus Undinarchaeales archaeon]
MSFEELNLIEPLQRAVTKEGYTIPTPIQEQAIPHLMNGRDLIGIAQTGTGKTAAFVLPILQKLSEEHWVPVPGSPRVLVLAPTRELAAQIDESFGTYGRFLKFRHTVVFGGVKQGQQVRALSRGVDILVATPGRLLDLMNQGYIRLNGVEYFVLDEVDRMLDMGFINDVRKIVSKFHRLRQSQCYSATMSTRISELVKSFLADPVRVEVTPQATTLDSVDQCVFFVDRGSKDALLLELIRQRHVTSALVFTRTKHGANKVARVLTKHGIEADAIHGNKTQNRRTQAMNNFKSGRIQVLVATDIAARGIDVEDISHVINYNLPNESEVYIHRIGRTARAGASGMALSLCSAEERDLLRDIERLTRVKMTLVDHKYHSDRAMNAFGQAARPPPRPSRGPPRRFRGSFRSGSLKKYRTY